MTRTDAVVLGAGIVGTSVALHLVKRGLSVALVDRHGPGEETSYGNAGIIEGATIYPPAFPKGFSELASIALKRASGTNYHLAFLPQIAPWLLSFRFWSTPQHLAATARLMRPLFDLAVAEHEFLMMESGAQSYLRKTGWLILYRSEGTFTATSSERDLASEYGIPYRVLDVEAARNLDYWLRVFIAADQMCWLSVGTRQNGALRSSFGNISHK